MLTQCHCIKVATFYLLWTFVSISLTPWLIKAPLSFVILSNLAWPIGLLLFLTLDAFSTLRSSWHRYKALTILRLSSQKVSSLINFLYYLACCMLILSLLGICLTIWSLVCLFNIYEHVWLSLCSSCLYYEAIWLVWPIVSSRLPLALLDLLVQVDKLLEYHLWMRIEDHLGLWPPTSPFQGAARAFRYPQVIRRLEDHLGWWPSTGSFQGPSWALAHPQVMWRLENCLGSWPPTGSFQGPA